MEDFAAGVKVKSIFCFVIAPEMRRKGIAKQLQAYICQDAAQDGFAYVEAYPEKKFVNVCDDYQGPVEIYRKSGFIVHYETEQKYVMRKQLTYNAHHIEKLTFSDLDAADREAVLAAETDYQNGDAVSLD